MKPSPFNAYLPIRPVLKSPDAPDADLAWLASRGIEGEALSVLRHVRDDVLPLVRNLERKRALTSFSFLVHDRTSGVPTVPEDHGAYIHLRLVVRGDARKLLPARWVMVKRVEGGDEVHRHLDPQCAWYLRLVEAHRELPDIELLQVVRRHLHFFANMSQMRVQ